MTTQSTHPRTLRGLSFGQNTPVYQLSEQAVAEVLHRAQNRELVLIEDIVVDRQTAGDAIRNFIGNRFTAAYLELDGTPVAVYCDDEGLLNDGVSLGWAIKQKGHEFPIHLMGKLLLTSSCTDEDGNDQDCPLSTAQIQKLITDQIIIPSVYQN